MVVRKRRARERLPVERHNYRDRRVSRQPGGNYRGVSQVGLMTDLEMYLLGFGVIILAVACMLFAFWVREKLK